MCVVLSIFGCYRLRLKCESRAKSVDSALYYTANEIISLRGLLFFRDLPERQISLASQFSFI